VLDHYTARPDNSSAATDTAERDCKERGEESSEMGSLHHLFGLLQVGHLQPPGGIMKRTRISLTALVAQEVPRPPIDCPKSRRSGANRVEVAEFLRHSVPVLPRTLQSGSNRD